MLGISIKVIINKKGLTLVELLVVMAIIGILAVIGLGQFSATRRRARDSVRKADLDNIAKAIQLYYVDHEDFPGTHEGKIAIFDLPDNPEDLIQDYDWGEEFKVGDTVYMSKLPQDPSAGQTYCYLKACPGECNYFIYARLENQNDPDIITCTEGGLYCNYSQEGYYNYVVTSPNFSREDACTIN